jgi:succinate-semialdehyde dehydrogenase / glutarate-semialdehyde dehydrogenase
MSDSNKFASIDPVTEERFATTRAFADAQQAIAWANGTAFGLGGSVWTRGCGRDLAVARQLRRVCAFVTELVKSGPRLPFGGVKQSGFGRELARHGMLEFVNAKTLWID